MKHFKRRTAEAGIEVLEFNNQDKEMNVLSKTVLEEFNSILDELNKSKPKGLLFMSSKEDQFIVGADVGEINSFNTAVDASSGSAAMQSIFQKLATLPCKTIAAIHGNCLGGGLELALACKMRVATDHPKTQLALPEIQLGLIPGAGGTQRLPRLIGIQSALDMILTGKRYHATKALRVGLVDAVVHPNLLESEAIRLLTGKTKFRRPKAGWFALVLEKNSLGRSFMLSKARQKVDESTKGFYPAAHKALQSVFGGYTKKLEDGLQLESKYFGELSQTSVCKSLIHLFDATTQIKKFPYKEAGKARFGQNKVNNIGVVGAGFMGRGIATVAAQKNIKSLVSDPSKKSVGDCLKHVRDFFSKEVLKKKIKKHEVAQKMCLVSPGLDTTGFHKSDVVIEAVFEDLDLKQKILNQLESQPVHKDWIFASNTSALPIQNIAAKSKHPERVIGMHFFSPVEKMPLLEVVKTDQTAPWVIARVAQLGFDLGKQVIIVKDGPGFYTTRALAFYLAEAAALVAEGVPIETIDKAMTSYGYPVGPLALIDEVGIDVGIHVLETIAKAFPDRMIIPDGFSDLKTAGLLGRKNNHGFYLYRQNKRQEVNSEIYSLLNVATTTQNKVVSHDYIIKRCHYLFVNEAIRCLDDQILSSPYDGDIGAVFGLGFPPFQGGPFHFCDKMGHANFVQELQTLSHEHGKRFLPAEGLLKGKMFYPS